MNQSEDRLDKLLRDWSQKQLPTATQQDALRERLVRAIETCNIEDQCSNVRPRRFWQSRVLWFGLGAAMAASICWVVLALRSTAPTHIPEVDGPDVALMQQEHIEKPAKVFAEVLRLFPGQLNWLAECNGAVELGISTDKKLLPKTDSRPIVIQILVASRTKGQTSWNTVWTAEVMTYEEQQVVLKESGQEPVLNLWSHRLPDEEMAIDTCLTLPGADKPLEGTAVITPAGQPAEILAGSVAQREFRVYQSVAHLALK